MRQFLLRIIISLLSIYPIRKIISLDLYSFFEYISVKTKNGKLKFFGFGHIPIWRAETLFTKEPETIEWIESFQENDVLWDIGANVGMYSIYAASLNRNIKILAFEPSSVNYYILNKNIQINAMDLTISAYPIAFSNQSTLGYFQMTTDEPGGAMHVFSKQLVDKNQCGDEVLPISFRQAMVGYSIDEFVKQLNPLFPNHIKIDVDSIEDLIVEGGMKTLSDSRIKSVLIELDDNQVDYTNRVISMMSKSGLTEYVKKHSSMFDTGKFTSLYNYIFTRKK